MQAVVLYKMVTGYILRMTVIHSNVPYMHECIYNLI